MGNGMGWEAISVSCRYLYRDSLCAHAGIDGDRCVGHHNCEIFTAVERFDVRDKGHRGAAAAGHYIGVQDLLPSNSSASCEFYSAGGMYCRKYSRFFCAGRGNCEKTEDYMRSFESHKKGKGG